jgi:DNA-binding NarL/FixJ family response regulator
VTVPVKNRHLDAAAAADAEVVQHRALGEDALRRRDEEIRKAFLDGVSAPAIGRALGMSTSNVRIITRDLRARR